MEFKAQIVELFRRGGRTFSDIASEFDLSPTTVADWVRAAANNEGKMLSESHTGGGDPQQPRAKDGGAAEIAALKRQLRQKEEELEVLGKALSYFARRKDQ
ncbi:helix-turn-helix domain-containing protein [Allokutzneria albata]|uniref:Transposase n=1 Tax=Allokutzneria albata TaxID=211114 RepID=A0A1G9S9N1_ALLAB|nr:transposase [Allokutzneria albata]